MFFMNRKSKKILSIRKMKDYNILLESIYSASRETGRKRVTQKRQVMKQRKCNWRNYGIKLSIKMKVEQKYESNSLCS